MHELGGVAVLITSGRPYPPDGGERSEVESSGKHCGWQRGRQVDHGAAASSLRFDAEPTEASAQLAGGERTTGMQAREEPRGGRDWGRKGGVVSMLVQLPAQQLVK